ncbi:hypothetical protein BH09BAC1_BH09BAC1_07790 [soil metagenome]
MNTKLQLNASTGMLFFLLLFSKPYVARCQTTPSNNQPTKQVVRMEVDTVIKGSNVQGSNHPNGKKVIIIEEGGLPSEMELAANDTNGRRQIIIIEKEIVTGKPSKKRRHKCQEPVVIKEVRVIKDGEEVK